MLFPPFPLLSGFGFVSLFISGIFGDGFLSISLPLVFPQAAAINGSVVIATGKAIHHLKFLFFIVIPFVFYFKLLYYNN
ncbi:hypothetical protein DA803_03180 [[Mycoplasma] phocae]|uniref:Uncharacterized protein n=1 Tax=[Mycoplasma] phocae TaxID=142651 RepID=A0A2Z5IQY5_9BACT|nr:hypothetical protein DA803_03180 [[Mycoplasma] phocae]